MSPWQRPEAHQRLPRAGREREALRENGQFWTPPWVAEAMIAYVLADGATEVFDPAVGEGAFVAAALNAGRDAGRAVTVRGCELDERIVSQVLPQRFGTSAVQVERRDFVLCPPDQPAQAIVANPPYIRHHRLGERYKAQLRKIAKETLGQTLDGRAGLHVYFLIRALTLLAPGGRLAFILPADVFEGVYSRTLWYWITHRFRLDAVVTFTPEATPFPGVDTNAVIVLLRNDKPTKTYLWTQCRMPGSSQLRTWASGVCESRGFGDLTLEPRSVEEGLQAGLARATARLEGDYVPLASLARVVRGIATGANDFFFMTRAQAESLHIPLEYFVRAIGRTRDLTSDELREEHLEELDSAGRPTYLLSLGDTPVDALPAAVRSYLKLGESKGLDKRPLISSRRPWYKMERREPPPLLFAYLGRRDCRFVRNLTNAVPLTGFLCVYPIRRDERSATKLWRVLNGSDLTAALQFVGKSYGGGAVKVEPRALERMLVSRDVIRRYGLRPAAEAEQLELA